MALSKTTQDHDEIQQWAETRGAKPAEVASTESEGQTGILRLEFPNATNANDSALKEISWDEFFEKFDASGLALVYQDADRRRRAEQLQQAVYPENVKSQSEEGPSAKRLRQVASKEHQPKSSAGPRDEVLRRDAQEPAQRVHVSKSARKSPAKKTAPQRPPQEDPGEEAQSSPKEAPAKKAPAKAASKAATKSSPAKKAPGQQSTRKEAPGQKNRRQKVATGARR